MLVVPPGLSLWVPEAGPCSTVAWCYFNHGRLLASQHASTPALLDRGTWNKLSIKLQQQTIVSSSPPGRVQCCSCPLEPHVGIASKGPVVSNVCG